jgi:hypothetical protein
MDVARVPPTEADGTDALQLPVRAYLDQTVVPLLLQGMHEIAKER